MAFGVSSGFTRDEYHVVRVDFIAPCGGTKEWGRRDLRIPPSPPSGLPPFQPWGIRCGGALLLPRACDPFRQLNSGAIAHPQFGIWCSCLCSGRYRTRFRRFRWVLGRSFFIIGGMDCSFLRLRGVLLWLFAGFALTAVGSIVLVDNGMEYQNISCLSRTNAFSNMVMPSLFGEMDLHQTKLEQFSRSAVIKKRATKPYKQRIFSTQ